MAENKNAKTPADEGQPVAWMHNFIENNVITHIPADIGRHPDRWTALYKDQTPCKTCQALAMAVMNDQTYHEKVTPKQWVGLTDEEIYEYADKYLYQHGSNYGIKAFGKAIEAKLKEKNA
jgi:ribonucleotide reductase beta subunit family protein with ferritin-like domain